MSQAIFLQYSNFEIETFEDVCRIENERKAEHKMILVESPKSNDAELDIEETHLRAILHAFDS